MSPSTAPDDARVQRLRDSLGAKRVDAMLKAVMETGRDFLPGDHHPVFGFLQRTLIHLKNAGHNCGLIFPKTDYEYRRFVDYFDGEDRIIIIYPGEGEPDCMRMDPDWVRPAAQSHPDCAFYEVVPGAESAIMLAFLEAYAHFRERDARGEE